MVADWRATHRNLSPADLRFRELAHDSPELLDRAQFRVLHETHHLLRFPRQSWPTFLGAEKLSELKRVSVGINRLLRGVPQRVLGGDPEKLCAFYGLGSPAMASLVFSTAPTGVESMLSRCDLIETASGFQCIEINFSANLGGFDSTMITERQLSVPAVARFLASEGLAVTYTDALFEMFRHIIEDVRGKGIARDGSLTVAFVAPAESVDNFNQELDYLNRQIRRTIETLGLALEGRVVICSPQRLIRRDASLLVGDQRIAAALELYGNWTHPHLFRAFKGHAIALYDGPLGPILSNKRNLALLSQHAASGLYSREEQALIEAHVPWTRLVAAGEIDYQGQVHSLVELVEARRERFVLKDGDAWGGSGVVLGRCVAADEWRSTLDRALAAGDWIVQEAVESLPYLYQAGDYGCAVHDLIWGPFVFGERYGGVMLRMQPKEAGGAVNLSRSASEGIVLEV